MSVAAKKTVKNTKSTKSAKATKVKASKVTKTAKAKAKAPVKTVKTEAKTPVKSDGLRKPQVRILQTLAKSSKALNRSEISAQAKVDLANTTELIGANKDEVRASNDAKYYPSLLTLKLVKFAASEVEGSKGTYFAITPAGKKAI